jgi:hypothetical protein
MTVSELQDEEALGPLELQRSAGYAVAAVPGQAADGSRVVEYHFPIEIEVRAIPTADADELASRALERLVDALGGA